MADRRPYLGRAALQPARRRSIPTTSSSCSWPGTWTSTATAARRRHRSRRWRAVLLDRLEQVKAVDARTGKPLWAYDPKVPGEFAGRGCCDVVNRGVAAWKGRIYVSTYDGRLVALDAKTGAVVWSALTLDHDKPVPSPARRGS